MVNKLSKDDRYLSKSKINDYYRNIKKEYGDIDKKYFVNAFNKCRYEIDITGMPGNKTFRRHTKYVKKQDLMYQALRDFIADSRHQKR